MHIYSNNYKESPLISISANLDNWELLQFWLQKYSKNPEMELQIANYQNELKEFSKNDLYGKTHIDKAENLITTQKIAKWLNGLSLLVLIWVAIGSLNIWSVPLIELGVVIAILIPLIIIYFSIRYKGFFNLDIDEKKIESFPNISSSLWTSSATLAIYWLLSRFYIFDTFQIWQYTFILSLIVTLPILYTARDINLKKIVDWFKAMLLITCMLGYAYGSIAYLNLYYDNSEAKEFLVEILRKEAGEGDKSADHITLAPWGTHKKSQKIQVQQYIFHHVKEGQKISVYLKEGYWGIRYYTLSLNESQNPT